jgi:hypothetical protein
MVHATNAPTPTPTPMEINLDSFTQIRLLRTCDFQCLDIWFSISLANRRVSISRMSSKTYKIPTTSNGVRCSSKRRIHQKYG